MAVGVQTFDDVHHLRDMVGCTQNFFRRFGSERIQVFKKVIGIDFGVIAQALPFFNGFTNDLVIHVGDVHDVMNLVAFEFQVAPEQIGK